MKKFFLFSIVAILFAAISYAQSVSINNDGSVPHLSAMLDVKHPNKGLLVPRVALTGTNDAATIPSPATSLLVYNTAANGAGATAVTPGFYHWNGTAWVLLSTGGGSGTSWLLTGNAGTALATNFLGTTDNNSFMFKVNNVKAGYIGVPANDGNVFWGYQSGFNNTGYSNIGVGINALFSNTAIGGLVAIGDSALYNNTGGFQNTAVGSKALYSNNSGFNNSANGYNALKSNTSGFYNTANGAAALLNNTTGNFNTANGASALQSNSTGSNNTANGVSALFSNTSGSDNAANGVSALRSNTTGSNNTAIGSQTLYSNTTGYSNVAIGVSALKNNTKGSNLVAIGDSALYNNQGSDITGEGYYNTAVGSKALFSNTTGLVNTANGYQALYSNATGAENTANGYQALFSNTTGDFNSANGSYTLHSNTTGRFNTANGSNAGSRSNNNFECTFIGYNAENLANNTNYTNSMALGSRATISASNQVRVGNSSVTSIGGQVGWTTLSDGRYKNKVTDNVPGLSFINKLKPVTYNLNVRALRNFLNEERTTEQNEKDKVSLNNESKMLIEKGIQQKEKIFYTGFIAQDVEKTAKEIGYDFSGVDAPKNEHDYYGLRYGEFVVPLVKAVQEQQQIIEDQNKKIDSQAEQIKKMNEKMEALAKAVEALTHK